MMAKRHKPRDRYCLSLREDVWGGLKSRRYRLLRNLKWRLAPKPWRKRFRVRRHYFNPTPWSVQSRFPLKRKWLRTSHTKDRARLRLFLGGKTFVLPKYGKKSPIPLLESRIDVSLRRWGLTTSILETRQWLNHGHIKVNNKVCRSPSYLLKPGDIVRIHPKLRLETHNKWFLFYRRWPNKYTTPILPNWVEMEVKSILVGVVKPVSFKEMVYPFRVVQPSFSRQF